MKIQIVCYEIFYMISAHIWIGGGGGVGVGVGVWGVFLETFGRGAWLTSTCSFGEHIAM